MTLLVCLMLEKVKLQQSFSSWPLHLTLVPWFELRGNELPNFINRVEKLCLVTPPLVLSMAENTSLGNRKLTLVKVDSRLLKLHHALIEIIHKSSANIINDRTINDGFKPHISHRGQKGPSRKHFCARHLFLVAKTSPSERQVVYLLRLENS